ncbi:hypothetical protein QVD17_15121 [Tagetes erecta]|uniref:Uncharacterized protein n=1 Tax=Tagetes erecta TaxID=13708 RepID=A0AAD8KNQ9_TARER|nr:hypothetical protein QVD17_15121 [Tagetes erecta]
MRCKKHYTDLTSISGVCSCCLRERLISLIAAQQQAQSQSQIQIQNLDGKHRNSDHNPPFPRSVSPYIHNRRRNQSEGAIDCSDNNLQNDHRYPHPHHRHSISDQVFYKTPQVQRPTFDGDTDNINNTGAESNKKRSFVRFLSFSNIFRSRNRKSVDSVSDLQYVDNNNNATSSPSWFSSIVRNRHRRKQSQSESVYVDESTVSVRRHICRDRGMSPARNSDVDESNNVDQYESVDSIYESTYSWKNTPRRTPAHQRQNACVLRHATGHRRNLSGLTFCLSPLVRASPKRKWNQKILPPEVMFSGEIKAPVRAHLANTKSFQANRSRKLADFGRRNHNR